MKVIHSLTLATGAIVVLAGCDPAERQTSKEKTFTQPRTAAKAPLPVAEVPREIASGTVPNAPENDVRIESGFVKTWAYVAHLKNEKIDINADNGAVTLTGTVTEPSQRPMAQHIAEALPGVRSVDNRIQIAGEPISEESDAWIRSRVRSVLSFHRNVSATKTEVDVVGGVVTLRGEALNAAQKDLTSEYAKDVQGVKDVTNEMTIAAAPDASAPSTTTTTTETTLNSVADLIDDGSITAQIKMSLLLHRSTSAMKTKVGTKDGVVTIGGEAKNSAEIDLVTKLVNDIRGVKSVINNMTVEKAVSKSD